MLFERSWRQASTVQSEKTQESSQQGLQKSHRMKKRCVIRNTVTRYALCIQKNNEKNNKQTCFLILFFKHM